jgi:hypothetical protein
MKFNKIWLTKKWVWRVNIYVDNWKTKYDELSDINLKDLINKIEKIEYQWEKINFEWFNNLFN